MKARKMRRRDVVRAVPVVMMAATLGGLGRALLACSSSDPKKLGGGTNDGTKPPPTDGDEYVPPNNNPPVDAGDIPKVPNPTWEARAKQLEDEQARVYGAIFTKDAPGVMAGKERSHVPQLTVDAVDLLRKTTVTVLHVMGANGLDAGPYDAAADAKPDVVDAGTDAADARADASDAGDAGDASAADAGKPPIHYITTVYLRAMYAGKNTVVGLWEFNSTDPAPPSVRFTLPAGVTSIEAYEWCTLHGLWKSDPVPVPP